jgi:hypothetical protein
LKVIELLDTSHDRDSFDCGNEALNQYFRQIARQRAMVIAENAGIIGLFVDAKDDAAKVYYDRYGFVSLEDTPLEMFLPLQTIRQIIE